MAQIHTIHTGRAADLDCYRYAIYWAPPASHPLYQLNKQWLGRDAESGEPTEPPVIQGLTAHQVHEVIRRPAHYGLHATLKSPFRLKDGMSARRLFDRVAKFVDSQHPFTLPNLKLVYRNGFFNLEPSATDGEIKMLADACVRDFDDLRAPLNDADIARRRIHELTDQERDYVYAWGYHRVFDNFNMHITLTSRLDEVLTEPVSAALKSRADLWHDPVTIDALSLFAQQTAGEEFRLIKRFSFGLSSR